MGALRVEKRSIGKYHYLCHRILAALSLSKQAWQFSESKEEVGNTLCLENRAVVS